MAYRHSAVKSLQSGTVAISGSATSNTATITAVDPANSLLFNTGQVYTLASTLATINKSRLELTNGTTVTAFRGTGNPSVPVVFFTVIEFYPGVLKSVQRGQLNLNNVTSVNGTISSVDLTKAGITSLGFSTLGADNFDITDAALTIVNATTVNAQRFTSEASDLIVGYQVAEFK